MNIDRKAFLAVAAVPLLAGCTQSLMTGDEKVADFGEANRQTMLAQVIDPEPEYDTAIAATSAEHAADAIERYANDAVKQPENISTVDDN